LIKQEIHEYNKLKEYIDSGKSEEEMKELSEKIEKYNKLKEKYEEER
jgi:hypothetical protein